MNTKLNIEHLIAEFGSHEPLYVTRPSLPDLPRYSEMLEQIWDSQWLTNNGQFHRRLEKELADYLGVEYLSLFCNGTIALLVALQALRISDGEVITTPFTFPATAHVLYWNRVRPVFCDIDPKTMNIDPNKLERLIGPDTKAILPVHVYGTPCDTSAIQEIADRHGLKVIYDAAHAFGAQHGGRSLASFGHMSMLSFHATKLFSTLEGGALVMHSGADKEHVDFLKNFGIANQETVIAPGINGKMNELQAAYGLLQLEMMEHEIDARRHLVAIYREELLGIEGVDCPIGERPGDSNGAYFPILIDSSLFGMSRDELHELLQSLNIHTRKYFYPLCSDYDIYASLPSAKPERLPNAQDIANRVLCLPLYGTLKEEDARRVASAIRGIRQAR